MSKSQKLLLFVHASYGLAAVMSGLFLNLYLWRISNDLTINALFIMVTFLVATLSFWIGGVISKKKDRKISYQLGIGLTACFYLFVILLQETVADIPMVIGAFNGLAAGFYWLGFFILLYDLGDDASRSAFLGKQMAVLGIVNTLGPAVSGLIINQFNISGYTIVFSCSFILFMIGFFFSFRLPEDTSPKKKLRTALLWRFNRRLPIYKKMWLGWGILGVCDGLISFLPPLLLFMVVDSEFYVSLVIIFLGITAICSSLWHSRYNTAVREQRTVLYLWFAYMVASLPLLFVVNLWTILFFLLINEICKALIGVSYFSFMFRLVGLLPKRAGLRIESLIIREASINTGRILSILLFITIYNVSQELIYYLLFITILTQGLLYKIMKTEIHTP